MRVSVVKASPLIFFLVNKDTYRPTFDFTKFMMLYTAE
ncbi:hypothetical protein FFONT_1126 [Fervidicoccus fontis Kam940]|uniref:Uncharacterized protein n=1 Tax=Fervidicoccus fontis (strain DSM 19380 / JCM 18336 / VKM B-2539 / Kam940) TaxID=1163730 RepID=I0A2A7_FERFK|nr:hypothetical protein FFONT_1126 [Fervidicoccus fontis Kam940]